MFNIKSLLIVAVACLMASTQVAAIACTPCPPSDRRDLSNVQVLAGRVCCSDS
ncbi:hypothetical protein DFH09DRAFT_1308983 [Mycena vulgaris]|nr:hypothetical protein DFH09DRAFT_1308983 [Mycena vulgaris]